MGRTIKLQSNVRMLVSFNKYKKQKLSCLIIQCSYRCYKARVILQKLKNDSKDFQKVCNERNVLQQEKLVLLNELKEARELLHAMQLQKQQRQQQQQEENQLPQEQQTEQQQKSS